MEKIIILGAKGNIGSTLVKQIFKNNDKVKIIGLVDINSCIFNSKELSKEDCFNFLENTILNNNSKEDTLEKALVFTKQNFDKEQITFIDTTAGKEPLEEFHKKIIFNSNHKITTANKNPLSFMNFEDSQKLIRSNSRYRYSCSVMAGADSLNFLVDLVKLKDYPQEIFGTFSGTLGFITSNLDEGKKFSEIIEEAYKLGYTEPDPRDDLNGLDVTRKLLIIGRTLGHKLELEDIKLEPFIPSNYFKEESIQEFLNSTKELDDYFNKKVDSAKDKNCVLRYVAQMKKVDDKYRFKVSLEEVSINSELGTLKGTLNKIIIISQNYPKESPYIIEAPGAGLEVTAQNVRRDLFRK